MFILAAFVLAYVAMVIGMATLVARAVGPLLPRLRRVWIGAGLVIVALALTPIPVRHGGFMLLVPGLVTEGLRERRMSRLAEAEAKSDIAGDRERQARLDARFSGYLPEPGQPGLWRDADTGLVWTGREGLVPDVSPASLKQAQARCASVAPPGYWTVPRSAEFYFLARAGKLEGIWLAELFLMPDEISVPGQVRGTGVTGRGTEPGVPIRCVAITPPAPRRGYLTSDIALDDWNRFQLGLPVDAK
jgi:hypothetical protein